MGRPLCAGCAGSVSAGVLAGLRQSVETLSVLSPICRRKKWVDRSSGIGAVVDGVRRQLRTVPADQDEAGQ
jgi:hypothetical protein